MSLRDVTQTAACLPGDGGVASILSQASLASSGSLDLFDPLPGSMSMSGIGNPTRKTPESFLGPNAALVNLDSLVTKPAQPAPVVNPFLASTGGRKHEDAENISEYKKKVVLYSQRNAGSLELITAD